MITYFHLYIKKHLQTWEFLWQFDLIACSASKHVKKILETSDFVDEKDYFSYWPQELKSMSA